MHHKIATSVITAFMGCVSVGALSAQPQQACTKDNFAGTYVFYEKGSAAYFPASSQDPTLEPFWAGIYAPFVTVGQVTMKPNGVGEGFYWIRAGSINGGAEPIPVELTITEFDSEHCTGKFTYPVTLPGRETTTVTERFILFDNGREFRTVPAVIQNGVPGLTWIGEGHRLSKPGEPLNTCGPQTASGSYVQGVENFVQLTPEAPILSDALLMRTEVSMNGDYTGTLYENLGSTYNNIMLPISGKITVNPDCSYESTLKLTIMGTDVTIGIRGVYFDQGKKVYGLQVSSGGTQFSFGQGERVTQ